jgi:UDP-N-acetylglucosamine diphosphorylase/glucosamine-1-phosphate N-acetyltransferase
MNKKIKAVVLAAGKGTRLQTEGCDLPKVMREALGKPLLYHVLNEINFLGQDNIIIVVGYQKDKVINAFPSYHYVEQKEQLGTGHAVMSAREKISGFDGSVLICYGDMPLIREETYRALIDAHFANSDDCTILAGTSNEDLPYGRIVRDTFGNFQRVVEDRDCTQDEKKIKELNVGVYAIKAEKLLPALSELKNSNSQGEYYLTDIPAIFLEKGYKVGLLSREMNEEIIGVNTVEQLQQVEKELRKRA